jgi:NNP family nitrate/nitrite transporter-like MFS transporter
LRAGVWLQAYSEVEPILLRKRKGIIVDPNVSDKECPIPAPFRPNLGRILFISALFFLSFMGRFIFAPLMPTIEHELDITHSQAGSLFLMISFGFFAAQICSGFLSSRVNHKGTLVLSTLGIGLALLIFNVSSSLWFIRVCLILLGMAAGLHIPSAIATITAMVSHSDWGKALALHQMAPPLSLVLCPLIANLMLGLFSWQVILAIFGVVTLIVGVAFRRFGRCGEFPGDAPRPAVVKTLISMRSYWIMVVLFALAMGGSIGLYTMLPLFLVDERGLGLDWANTLLGLSRISGLFMPFVAGWLMVRMGEKILIFMVLLFAGITTIMLGAMSGPWLVVFLFLQPAVLGCFFTVGFAVLARIVQPNLRSIAASFTTPTAFVIGGGALPMLIGYMGQSYSFGLGIVLIGGVTIVVSCLVFFLKLVEKMEAGC